MASHDGDALADPDDPGIAFQAGFGFYLGVVVTGILAIGGILADATTATLLGLLPSTLTFVTVAGHIAAKRARGLPERIGGSRVRRFASYVPAGLFAAIPAGAEFGGGAGSGQLVITGLGFAVLTAVSAFGVNRVARKRYAEAMTGDEPTVTWTWYRTTHPFGKLSLGAMLVTTLAGLALAATGNLFGLLWAGYGALFLLANRFEDSEWFDFDSQSQWNPPEIRAYDAGIVIKGHKLVPWDDITDVRLTDDELVLEREGWQPDIRCDRSEMDDPEAVFEGIERARAGVDSPDRDRPETDLRERDAAGEGESAPLENETDLASESESTDLETRTESERRDLETDTETA